MKKVKLMLAFVALFMVSSSVFGQDNDLRIYLSKIPTGNENRLYIENLNVKIMHGVNSEWHYERSGWFRLYGTTPSGYVIVSIPDYISPDRINSLSIEFKQTNLRLQQRCYNYWLDLVVFDWLPDPRPYIDPVNAVPGYEVIP